MLQRTPLRAGLLLLCSAGLGCTELRDPPPSTPSSACVGCHGNEVSPAPTDAVHQAHLNGTAEFPAIPCETCHVVPKSPAAPGHLDSPRPAEITFAARAVAPGGPAPSYDPKTRTCSNVSCHGARLGGGKHQQPVWSTEVGSQVTCGSCHGAPPVGSHPSVATCGLCHPTPTAETHVDGAVEIVFAKTCSGCHGDDVSPAPVSNVHRTHVLGTGEAKPVACSRCHLVPGHVDDAGHLGPAPAEVTIAGAAAYVDGSCSATYCHGSKAGGSLPAPSWKDTSGAALQCGACHGEPPPPPHPQAGTCVMCHSDVVAAGPSIKDPSLHVDGKVDLALPKTCDGCHGADGNPQPPDGGHKTHLGTQLTTIACETCHKVPKSVLDTGHVDSPAPVELTFGGKAQLKGATPVFASGTCSGTYCHGAASPKWVDAKGPGAPCSSCHGAPPGGKHPQSDRCDVCHADVVGPGPVIKSPLLHINGQTDVLPAPPCNGCHQSGDTNAPPTGAHATHVAKGYACTECHLVPTLVTDAGHLDSPLPAEVTFGPKAKMKKAQPVYDPVTKTCSGTYCHGSVDSEKLGGTLHSPVWDATDGAAKACGSCHAAPPPVSPHIYVPSTNCEQCHNTAPEKHINGTIDF